MSTKKDLLGAITKLRSTGGHKPILGDLRKPFAWDMAVIFSFCTGCGTKLEHNLRGAKSLADEAKIQIPSNHRACYFETTQCLLCGNSNRNVQLKKF